MLDLTTIQTFQLKNKMESIKTKETIDTINKAFDITKSVLKNAYNENGINAGQTHFSDVWIRDSAFAGWGALSIGDNDIIKRFLAHSLDNMNESGQCPLRIGQKYFLLKYIGLKGPQGPTYIEDKYISIPKDSNSLLIILFLKYIEATNDIEFCETYYQRIKQAMLWYDSYLYDNLVTEGPYGGWADSIKKKGRVLYTNVLYFEALKSVTIIAEKINNTEDKELFNQKTNVVKEKINDQFWNGHYFNDWIYKTKTKETLSIEANMLAILFDICDEKKTNTIVNYLLDNKIITPFGCPVVHKNYKWNDVYPPFLFIGLKDYHNGLIWSWISCIASVALSKSNKKEAAIELMEKIAKKIVRHNTVYEVYTKKGVPVNRLFYKSEEGFAWSAGLYIWAYQTLFNSPK